MALLSPAPADRQMFFEELHSTVRSGLPLSRALGMMADGRAGKGAFGRATADLARGVSGGSPLSDGMKRHEECFTPVDIAIVRMGEASGKLEEACRILASAHQSAVRLRRSVTSAVAYPGCVLLLGVVLLAVPYWFSSGPGAFLMAALGPILALAAAWLGGVLLWNWAGGHRGLRPVRDRLADAIPGVGALRRTMGLIHATRSLGHMMDSGVSPLVALEVAGEAAGHAGIRRAFEAGAEVARRGGLLAPALVASGLYRPLEATRLVTSEPAGRLPEACVALAEEMEERLDHRLRVFGKLLPVAVMFLVFALLGYRVVRFYTGHYEAIRESAGEAPPK